MSRAGLVDEKAAIISVVRNEAGMALLVTILMLSLLVTVTIQYHKKTWHKLLVSNTFKVTMRLKTIADSGVNISLALLAKDGGENTSDSLLDDWATVTGEQFADLFSGGTLKLQISDLSGRLPVNSLVGQKQSGDGKGEKDSSQAMQEILLRLLQSGQFPVEDDAEARAIVDALVDWIDSDDRESDFGAESGYYQSLQPSYGCRNGPVQSLEELLLVKGITADLLFGAEGTEPLADYLTVYGDKAKININTAPALLVRSFDSLIDEDLMETFDLFRREEENEEALAEANWYKNLNGWPGDIVLNPDIIMMKSDYFSILATGEFDTWSYGIKAIVERSDGGKIKQLMRRVE